MRTVGLVPARSGSKGVKDKNVRMFHGKPLLAWAVEVGMDTCEEVYISTDDEYIGSVGCSFGADLVRRSKSLARDDTPMYDVVRDFVSLVQPDVVVLLQPTQPLRTADHVRQALHLLEGADSVVSVVELPAHNGPSWALVEWDGELLPWDYPTRLTLDDLPTRRQDMTKAYTRDGTVYVLRREVIERGQMYGKICRPLIVPAHESCNIDTEEDWNLAEQMVRERNGIRQA